MYDPAEPTGDEIQSTEHSNGGLTVTIDGNKRSVTEDCIRDSGSDGEKTDNSDRKSQYFCHACMVECYNNKNFKNHMRGTKHRSRMDDLANLHQQKATQLFVRLKAEEHLRNIEKRGAETLKKHYCSVCELNLSIPYNKHRQTREHQLRVLEVYGNNKGNSNLQRKGQKIEEYTEVPEYEENKAYGQNYIIPVSGYFCKLCHKFYNNENAAKNTHCQSKAHFEKFEKIIREKIEAKKKAEAAESEDVKEENELLEDEDDEGEMNKESHLEENCEGDDDDDEEEEEEDDEDAEDADDEEAAAAMKDEEVGDDQTYMKSEDMEPDLEDELDKTLVPDDQNEGEDEVSDAANEESKEEEDQLLADETSSQNVIEKAVVDTSETAKEDTKEKDDEQQQPLKKKQPIVEDKQEKKSSDSPSEEEEKEKEQTTKSRNHRSRGRGRGRGRGKK